MKEKKKVILSSASSLYSIFMVAILYGVMKTHKEECDTKVI